MQNSFAVSVLRIRANLQKKKMEFKCSYTILFWNLLVSVAVCAISSNSVDNNALSREMNAKSLLSSLTGNLMNRGYPATTGGASQVVSLNITNLIVLVLLKALIFAAGSLGAGTWKGGYGRSSDGEEKFLTEDEALLYISFLTGNGNNECLQSIACRQPNFAQKYAGAGDILLHVAQSLSLETDDMYKTTLNRLHEAVDWGISGGDCNRYLCSN